MCSTEKDLEKQSLVNYKILTETQEHKNDSSCCSKELVSFVRPREFYSFDARHAIRSRPIGKCISIGGGR